MILEHFYIGTFRYRTMNAELGSIALIRDERIDRVMRTKEKIPDYSLLKK